MMRTATRRSTKSGRRRRAIALIAATFVAGGLWATNQAGAGTQPPIQGVIDVVYVAVGTNYPDSLGVGPGAAVNGAPIILVPTDGEIPGPTQSALTNLDPRKVVIIGGTAVISAEMEAAIEALLPDAIVERIAGANRYETNALFSQSIYPIESWISIPAAAFTSDQPADDDVTLSGTVAFNNTDGHLIAPIRLPDGAQILAIKADFLDDDPGENVTVRLTRVTGNNTGSVVTVTSNGNSSATQTQTGTGVVPSRAFVDNDTFAYFIEATNTSGGAVFSTRLVRRVMIHYRLGAPEEGT